MNFLPDGRMLILSRTGSFSRFNLARRPSTRRYSHVTNVNTDQGERGLTGFALDPNFNTNHYFYLFYTANSPLRDRVSRFTMVGSTATPSSELVVWQDDVTAPLVAPRRKRSCWPDGKIYISTGDGFDRGGGTAGDSPPDRPDELAEPGPLRSGSARAAKSAMQVVGVLEADRHADRCPGRCRSAASSVGREARRGSSRRRVRHERLGTAERRRQLGQPHALDERAARLEAAGQVERRARAAGSVICRLARSCCGCEARPG